jgi:hypothetical protein
MIAEYNFETYLEENLFAQQMSELYRAGHYKAAETMRAFACYSIPCWRKDFQL